MQNKFDKHNTTLVIIYDDREDGAPVGWVVIKGRMTQDNVCEFQKYVRELAASGPITMERIEERAREKWFEEKGWEVIYPLYWEQVRI